MVLLYILSIHVGSQLTDAQVPNTFSTWSFLALALAFWSISGVLGNPKHGKTSAWNLEHLEENEEWSIYVYVYVSLQRVKLTIIRWIMLNHNEFFSETISIYISPFFERYLVERQPPQNMGNWDCDMSTPSTCPVGPTWATKIAETHHQ